MMVAVRSVAARPWPQPAAWTLGFLAVVLLILCVLIVVPAPTLGGGDYGQWLMVARHFRGLDVPAYRDVGALPPLVPGLLGLLWAAVGNPVTALDLLNAGLMVSLVLGFAGAGYALFRDPIAAVAGPVIGLLVFDRFAELFAFGGILQLAGDAAALGSIAALIAAEARPDGGWRLRVAAVLLLDLCAVSHVGTTEAVLPVFLVLTGVLALRAARRSGFRLAVRAYGAPLLLLAPTAVYWMVEILPANGTYFTNPATAAYRDPGSFVAGLFAYGPNAIVLTIGTLALLMGAAMELRARRLGPWTLVGIWAAVAWSELGVLALVGTPTDYPRFATVLTPPPLLAVGGAAAMLVRRLMRADMSLGWPRVIVLGALAIVVATPSALQRDGALNRYYAAPGPASLDSAVQVLESTLRSEQGTVLTSVRAGKWLEGTTGRPALFSQPTRFAVRPAEWQRSLDAYVLANASAAIASPAFLVQYQHSEASRGHASFADLVVASNHDGEWVNLFASIVRDTFVVDASGRKHSGASFYAAGDATQGVDGQTASIATSWIDSTGFSMQRIVSVSGSEDTARLVEQADGLTTTRLYPADGISLSSFAPDGNSATVCFTTQGRRPPCVGLVLADPTGTITAIGDGGVWIRGGAGGGLDLTITNMTVGSQIVGLESLSPTAIARSNHIVGAILETSTHGYADAALRLTSLGFQPIDSFDPYAVFAKPPP